MAIHEPDLLQALQAVVDPETGRDFVSTRQLKNLRVEPWAREIPIIAITGWGQDDDRQRSKDAGFDAHLVKPVVFEELTALLDERGGAAGATH